MFILVKFYSSFSSPRDHHSDLNITQAGHGKNYYLRVGCTWIHSLLPLWGDAEEIIIWLQSEEFLLMGIIALFEP
jgi:hypothetical protein